jgi:hypothetical protein
MAVMLEKLYDALLAGNVPDEKAREAAREGAEFKDEFVEMKSTLRLHTWMLSANTAGILLLLGLALRHS